MKMTRCGQRRAALQLSPERRESPRLCHRRNIPGLLPGLGRRMAAPRCFFRLAQAEMFWRILRGRTKLLRRRQGDRQRRSPTTSDYVATSARSAWVVRPDELQSRVHRASAPDQSRELPRTHSAPLVHVRGSAHKSSPNLDRPSV